MAAGGASSRTCCSDRPAAGGVDTEGGESGGDDSVFSEFDSSCHALSSTIFRSTSRDLAVFTNE